MRKIMIVIVAASALAGCAQSARDERALTGAALGAGTGALIGGLAGGTTSAAVAGAAAGGIVGGAIGASTPPPLEDDTCYVRTRSGRMRPVPC